MAITGAAGGAVTSNAYVPINNAGGTALYVVPNRAMKLLKRFYAKSTAIATMNRMYEGELKKKGDSVTVPQRPVISVGTYTQDKVYTYPTLAADAARTLTIDTAYDFEFGITDLDKIQAYIKGFDGDWIDEAQNRLRIAAETVVQNGAPAKVHAKNTGKTAGAVSGVIDLGTVLDPLYITREKSYTDAATGIKWTNAVDVVTSFSSTLAEQNIDEELEHFFISPVLFQDRLAGTDIKSALVTGDGRGVIRGGPNYIGEVSGFQGYKSNLFTPIMGGANGDVKVFPVLFGVSDAWSFAAQMTDFWSGQLQTKAGMGYRGIMIFGWEVMIPEALGVAYVTFDNHK